MVSKLTSAIITLVMGFEGCYLTAYKCPAGVWTIGYGHTNNVKKGQKINRNTAKRYLEEDMNTFLKQLNKRAKFKKCDNQNVGEAMVSFAFNCGAGNFDKLAKNRNWYQILANMYKYNKGGGKVLNGLVKRRHTELVYATKFVANNGVNVHKYVDTQIIQGCLNKAIDSKLDVDGCFGQKTRKAVMNFQTKYKLEVSGVVNKSTWNKLIDKGGLS